MSPDELARLRELEAKAFCAPWTYSEWDIECPTCEAADECVNPECDGAHVPCTTLESPEEYPNGQIVAQFTVPGLSRFADANGEFIVALRNAAAELLDAADENAKLQHALNTLRPKYAAALELVSGNELDRLYNRNKTLSVDNKQLRARVEVLERELQLSWEAHGLTADEAAERIGKLEAT